MNVTTSKTYQYSTFGWQANTLSTYIFDEAKQMWIQYPISLSGYPKSDPFSSDRLLQDTYYIFTTRKGLFVD